MAGLLQIVLHARKQDVHMSFPSIFGKMPKFPLIVFGALFFVVQATYLEDVKKFTEIFATFKNDSTDMEKLETMAGIHEKLLKYAVPVGFLLATGINKTFSPGSDGDQALQYLNNELTKKFKLLKMKFQDDRAPFRYYVYYSAYADIIQSGWRYYQRDVSERLYKWYYDYGITKDFFVNFEKYGRKCSGDFYDRASYLLMDLYRGRGCLIYEDMKDHILKYVGTQRAVREAESRVKNRTSENPDGLQELLQDVRDRIWTYSSSDEPWMYPRHKMRSQLLNEINPETLDDLLKELLYFLARFPKRGPSCELYRENFFYGFKKPDLLYAVQDLLKYQWMQMACAAVDASNNPGSFGYRIRTYAIELAAIAGKYATYYRSIENLTWPEIHVEAAKRAIGFDKISPKKFNKTAGIIQKELEKYMPDGYSFQVLITETRQKNVYWVAESKTDDYVRFTDLNGIDCHIFRYRTLGASEQAKNATAYFQLHHQALKNILENAVYSTDMRGVMKQLLQAVDFNNNSACNSAILLRNEAFFVKNLKIRTGVASLENNTNSVEFSINQFYKTARAWKFYLFI